MKTLILPLLSIALLASCSSSKQTAATRYDDVYVTQTESSPQPSPQVSSGSGQEQVYTDPNATVAWSENLSPNIKTNLSFGNLLGRGSGESFQLEFKGEGWVLVQPYEEIKYQQK